MGRRIRIPSAKRDVAAIRRVRLVGLIVIAGCWPFFSIAAPGAGTLTRFTYTEYHMGVDARLVVYAPDLPTAKSACQAAFKRIAELDWIMSDYRQDSELMRLCNKAGGPPSHVSPELFKVLKKAEVFSRQSDGAFDITVGPLVRLWRAARKSGVLPKPEEIAEALTLVGSQKVRLDPRTHNVRLTVKGMKLDLGGIAKGFADDEAQRVLKAHGITRALVEMGGDIVVTNPPPGTMGWAIQVPNAGAKRDPVTIRVANCAVSTSGDTEQFVIIGGKRYSHVINPHTGIALTNRVEATVITKDGLTSDPLSKIPALLGTRAFARLMRKYTGAKSYVRIIPGTN